MPGFKLRDTEFRDLHVSARDVVEDCERERERDEPRPKLSVDLGDVWTESVSDDKPNRRSSPASILVILAALTLIAVGVRTRANHRDEVNRTRASHREEVVGLERRIQELVDAQLGSARALTLYIGSEIAERNYLLTKFAGDAQCSVRENAKSDGQSSLTLTCKSNLAPDEMDPEKENWYAGIILYGNSTVTGAFDPIDLKSADEIVFEYRYPAGHESDEFYLRVKNLYETESSAVRIPTTEPNQWQSFSLATDDEVLSRLAGETTSHQMLMVVSFAAEKFQGVPEIEIRNLGTRQTP